MIAHFGGCGVSITLGQFGSRQIERLPQRNGTQVYDFVRRIHVEGEQSQMLLVEPRQNAGNAITLQNVGRNRQRHFKCLPGIADVNFELAGDVRIVDTI